MESWRIIAWLTTIGSVIAVLAFLTVPPIVWWVYRRYIAPLEDRYRTFWPRLWASWIDGVVLLPFAFVFGILLQPEVAAALWEKARWVLIVVFLVNHAYLWFYSIYMHARWGQTVGKMTTRVRVVDAVTEEPITFKKAFLRDGVPILILFPLKIYSLYSLFTESEYNIPQASSDYSALANIVDWTDFIAGVWWFAEIVTMLTNEKRRALHDFIAGTVVVRMNVEEDECQT